MDNSSSESSTSRTLIERLRVFDSEAWQILSRLYGPLVYRWARRTGLQSQDAADVLQNVLLSVMRGIAKFSHEKPGASFRGWLRTITQNAVRELNRRRVSRPQASLGTEGLVALPSPAETETEQADPVAFSALVHRALALVRERIDTRTWDAFWRTAVVEESTEEVAAELSMTPVAVRKAKFRVLCRLRDLLVDR